MMQLVGDVTLSILHYMVSAHSDLDDAGEVVTPTPRVKWILLSLRSLPHVAQAMLIGEQSIVESAASLLKAIVTRNPKAMIRLYSTGAFYFALAYPGSNLLSIAYLFSATHIHQAFYGGEEAVVSSSLPLTKHSVLGGLLPESLCMCWSAVDPLHLLQQWLLILILQKSYGRADLLWYLLPLLLQYDSTAEESGTNEAHGVGSSVQIAKNMHAIRATEALSRLCGLCGDEASTLYNQSAAIALRALLTPKLANMLKNPASKDLLSNLNTNLESPEIIWNSSIRAELLKFVDQERASQNPDGSYDLTESHSFACQALSNELHVGNVYLRVYNNQPGYEISEPETFCVALLEFIPGLVQKLTAAGGSDVQKEYGHDSSFADPAEVGIVTDSGVPDEEKVPDSLLAQATKEGYELVNNLHTGLISLQNLLTSNPSLAAVLSTKEQLIPLFECLTVPPESKIPEICLSVLSLLTKYAPCLEAMITERANLILLLQMLHMTPRYDSSMQGRCSFHSLLFGRHS